MTYQPSRTSKMDKVLMIKELYAAVDHLEENLAFATSIEDQMSLRSLIDQMTQLRRDTTASLGGNKNYACLFKHAIGAWKAAEEVWLADDDSDAFERYKKATELFYNIAELFLGEKLSQCERCETETGEASDGSIQSIHKSDN